MITSLSLTLFFFLDALFPTQVVSRQLESRVLQQVEPSADDCSQTARKQTALIREAEVKQYTTRRIEFLGNQFTRDQVLRREFVKGLNEGDFFTRRNLNRSLRSVSKLETIYPVRPKDVVVRLNRDEKHVDILVCFREKRR